MTVTECLIVISNIVHSSNKYKNQEGELLVEKMDFVIHFFFFLFLFNVTKEERSCLFQQTLGTYRKDNE